MTVQRVTITTAGEKYAPPSKEIDISVVGGIVFITVYDGSDDNIPSTRKKVYEVPEITLPDLTAAIAAHGFAIQGWLHNGAERSPSAQRTQAEAEDSAKPSSRAEASD